MPCYFLSFMILIIFKLENENRNFNINDSFVYVNKESAIGMHGV
jgi:hypothetical protein